MKCTNCGKEISDGTKFCKYCGAQVKAQSDFNNSFTKICKKCGASLKEGTRFCDKCGTPVYSEFQVDDESEPKKSKNLWRIIFTILILLVLIGLGMLAFSLAKAFSSFNDTGDNQNQEEEIVTEGVTNLPEESDTSKTKSEKRDSTNDDTDAIIDQEAVKNTAIIDVNIPQEAVTFGGHSYCIFDNGCESWNEAEEYCESRGGYLAVINSSKENEFLYDYMLNTGYDQVFFGYTDQNHEGTWEWVAGKKSEYQNWGINQKGEVEPNADSEYENYAHMNSEMHDGHWNDKRFGKVTACYYCEWDVVNYQENDYKGKVVHDDVLLKNNSLDEADDILKLKSGEELKVLYLLTKDNGEEWYYVQHKTGVVGYVRPEALLIN